MREGPASSYNQVVRSSDSELEIWLDDEANTAAVWRETVLVQVRRGPLDPRLFERGEGFFEGARARDVPVGLLSVVEAGAPMVSQDVRSLQRGAVDRLGAYAKARVAPVFLGDDLTASLARSSARLLGVSNPRIQRFQAIAPAVAWMGHELTALGAFVHGADLLAAVETVRRRGA